MSGTAEGPHLALPQEGIIGLHPKYDACRRDGAEQTQGSKHYGGCNLFVLDLTHDPAALVALAAYADAIEATKPVLAAEIRKCFHLTHDTDGTLIECDECGVITATKNAGTWRTLCVECVGGSG